ncbi:MAG: hypothetical protein U0625_12620 [Phycisphaerales bacterium]
MKPKPFHCPTLLVVVQKPFLTDSGEFCKLAPLIYLDGDYPRPEEFLNDGEVWWMLTPRTRGFAEPGRIVVAQLERAVRFDERDEDKSSVQAVIDSIRDPGKDDVFQVIRMDPSEASSPQDFVESFRIAATLRHLGHVFVHWRSSYYGPFRAIEDGVSASGGGRYKLVPQDVAKSRVYEIDGKRFGELVRIEKCSEAISTTSSPRRSPRGSSERIELKFEYFLASCLSGALNAAQTRELVLEPIGTKLRRVASQCLVRKDSQQFKGLLENLEQRAIDQQASADLLEAIRSRRSAVEADLEALDALATAMLEQGLLGPDRLERMEKQIADRYLSQHGSELRAKLDTELETSRRSLGELRRELTEVEANIKQVQQHERAEFLRQLDEERGTMLAELEDGRKKLEQDRAEIEHQQHVLKGTLVEVTRNLSEEGDKIINQFLALEPLLGLNTFARGGSATAASSPHHSASPIPPSFQPVIRTRGTGSPEPISEAAFVDRVLRRSAERGLAFRRGDIERFHLSVKTGEITVLCGPSGTGKSSLAMVYGEALRGEEPGEHESHIVIPVSPTWLDARDLLGHVSASERQFIPSESGLYEFLLTAEFEQVRLGEGAGIALAILDEMNLSQVEHYFGDLMLALERKGLDRAIRCFSKTATLPSCPFHKHGRIRLSESLRVVGTMNFDETVRQLSDRFLDRTNVIYLSTGGVGSDTSEPTGDDCGRTITRQDFAEWSTSRPLEGDMASFIDELYRLMERLAHPVSQRVRDDLYRYICTSGNLVSQGQATDQQIAQRVLSKVRLMGSRSQREAFELLQRHIDAGARDFGLPVTMSAMHRIRARLIEDLPDED